MQYFSPGNGVGIIILSVSAMFFACGMVLGLLYKTGWRITYGNRFSGCAGKVARRGGVKGYFSMCDQLAFPRYIYICMCYSFWHCREPHDCIRHVLKLREFLDTKRTDVVLLLKVLWDFFGCK